MGIRQISDDGQEMTVTTIDQMVYTFDLQNAPNQELIVSNEDANVFVVRELANQAVEPAVLVFAKPFTMTATTINIPDYMNEALELLTAYFMLQALPSSAEFTNGTKEIFARYQEEINSIYENMLLRTAEETGKRFGTMDRGWV